MRLSLISVLVIAFSTASLVSATPTGSSTTGDTLSVSAPPKLETHKSSTNSLAMAQGAPSSDNQNLPRTEEQIRAAVRKKEASHEAGKELETLYRKELSELDANYLNGGRPYSVIIKNYRDKCSKWTGPVIITLISRRGKARFMEIVMEREREELLVAWADRSHKGLKQFIIVKRYEPAVEV